MRILAIDYGTKRCGLAATDPLRLIASPLETVATHQLWQWLEDYLKREEVSDLVVGESVTIREERNPVQDEVVGFERKFARLYPAIRMHRQDEFNTSQRARRAMIDSGMKKKRRMDKKEVDRLAAALILQDFMDENA